MSTYELERISDSDVAEYSLLNVISLKMASTFLLQESKIIHEKIIGEDY